MNAVRSTPFIILLVAIIPLTRLIAGTSIGTAAAIVPLTIAAAPLIARLVETSLREVDKGLIEAAQSMGATDLQIIVKVLIPEALPGIIAGLTIALVALVGASAMAEAPTSATSAIVSPAIIPGSASGIRTFTMICRSVAPIDCAASMRPLSTSRRLVSTRRAINGAAAIVNGTIAAAVPMDVPAIRRVKGMIATSKMMKGVERTAFTSHPNGRLNCNARI